MAAVAGSIENFDIHDLTSAVLHIPSHAWHSWKRRLHKRIPYACWQALAALRAMGEWTALNVHCGNLFVDSNGNLQLAEWEAALLGTPATLEQAVEALRPNLEPAGTTLCHALYEMACGYESSDPIPTEYPPHCSQRILTHLEVLFRPKSTPGVPKTLEDISAMPFFSCSPHAVQLAQLDELPPLDHFCAELLQQQRQRAKTTCRVQVDGHDQNTASTFEFSSSRKSWSRALIDV